MVLLHFQVGLSLFIPEMHITNFRGASKYVTSFQRWTPWTSSDNQISMKGKPLDSHMVG